MVLVEKWPFFQVFSLGNIGQENVFCDILKRKNGHLIKKWPFFHVPFLGNKGQENFFYNILERKNAFLAYKNKKFKKSKN